MTSMHSSALALVATALFITSCGLEPSEPTPPDANLTSEPLTLSRDIQPILDMYCVKCHAYGAGDPHGEPHFTADSSQRAFQTTSECTSGGTRLPLVVPGNPAASFLLYKLGAPTDIVTVTGMDCVEMMPLREDEPLVGSDPDAVETIRQWILDGAL